MALRVLRVGAGTLLGTSGALMYAASWQRWAERLPVGRRRERGVHRAPGPSLRLRGAVCPVGAPRRRRAAGWVVPAGPCGRVRAAAVGPDWPSAPVSSSAAALVGAVLGSAAVGVATLRSGIAASVVPPASGGLALYLWLWVPPVLLVRFAVAARGWALAAAVGLILGTPFVAAFLYSIGPYDAQPSWEGGLGSVHRDGRRVSAGCCRVRRSRARQPGHGSLCSLRGQCWAPG